MPEKRGDALFFGDDLFNGSHSG